MCVCRRAGVCIRAQNVDCLCPLPDATHMRQTGRQRRERELSAGWFIVAFRSGWQRWQQLDIGQDTHTFTHTYWPNLCVTIQMRLSQHSVGPSHNSILARFHLSCVCARMCTYTRTHTHSFLD